MLTEKQKRFADEYLIDLNATRAAIRAGYSEKTAYSMGQRLLKNVEIQNQIHSAMKDRENRTQITQERVLAEYAKLAFFDPRKLFDGEGKPLDITQLDDDTAAAIAGLEVNDFYDGFGEDKVFMGYVKKYKVTDKKGALDSLARHLGLFNDKVQISGTVTIEQLLGKVEGQEF